MTFKDLGLNSEILRAIEEKGYEKPSTIQEKAIPEVLNGNDLLASAQTGTGKTAGFALPILDLLTQNPVHGKKKVRALILTPTRELAAQIQEEVKSYAQYTNLRSTVIFGGVKQNPQVAKLRAGVDILIATPGRLLDLVGQKLLRINEVEIFVLDEADRMLDMGFIRDIKKILEVLPPQRQNLLFSATFSKEIEKLANRFLSHPVKVEAAPKNARAEKIDQDFYRVDKSKKAAFLIKTIKENSWEQTLIFTRTKHGANRLCKKLDKQGITAAAIHGNKTQNARTKALADFKNGDVQCLVATDIAARGLDIPLLPQVVNYELPNIPEDYVHRIGRTGRAGASGYALNLVQGDEIAYVRAIEKLVKDRFDLKIDANFEPEEEEEAPKPPARRNNFRKRRR